MPHLDASLDELSIGELLPGLCTMFGAGVVLKCTRRFIYVPRGEYPAAQSRRTTEAGQRSDTKTPMTGDAAQKMKPSHARRRENSRKRYVLSPSEGR
jgi:hypothetical protein